jgi:methylase of polypeptide subunit release factors
VVAGPLLELLRRLAAAKYEFVTVTPATHRRVFARAIEGRPTLREIFGWNRRFEPADLDGRLFDLMRTAGVLEEERGRYRSKVRVASLAGTLFLHSSFPTKEENSVFFGPDTYRFARFIEQRLPMLPHASSIVDVGAGAGAGGILAGRLFRGGQITLVDVNDKALGLAQVNARFADVAVATVRGSTIPAGADVVLANPPYMMDSRKRDYRDGGELLGGAVALDWARQALSTMAPGGTMLLYSGAAYKDGEAPLILALKSLCAKEGATLDLEELDPDVFGEELEEPAYRCVERIAVLNAAMTKAGAK